MGFPTNATENGAAFLLMYLILAFLLAYPALMAELIIGRHTRSNMVNALTKYLQIKRLNILDEVLELQVWLPLA